MDDFKLPDPPPILTHGEYILLGPDVQLNFMSESNRHQVKGKNPWDPLAWESVGWTRNWGDAAVMSPYFEVLRKGDPTGGAKYIILCPTFLRRPLQITHGPSWGSY